MSISPIPVQLCTSFRRSTADETFAHLHSGINARNLSSKKSPIGGRTASYIIKLLISRIIPPHLTRPSPPTSALATACRGEWQSVHKRHKRHKMLSNHAVCSVSFVDCLRKRKETFPGHCGCSRVCGLSSSAIHSRSFSCRRLASGRYSLYSAA